MITTFKEGSPEHQAALEKKKIADKNCPRLTSRVSRAFRKLMEVGLFKPLQGTFKELLAANPGVSQHLLCHALARGFFVEKSNNLLRVITDARWTNALFDRSELRFSMFAFHILRQVIDNSSYSGKPWYTVNLDLRLWFHQIPLPKRYHSFRHPHD